eukprot:GHVQ01013109.1.p1 GENE.GHVQ01013109.1~~GHVQ01013109.1.p1  ORF type:complete len:1372 (-),score=119.76 GHVQ01013109.1:353-4468(-)
MTTYSRVSASAEKVFGDRCHITLTNHVCTCHGISETLQHRLRRDRTVMTIQFLSVLAIVTRSVLFDPLRFVGAHTVHDSDQPHHQHTQCAHSKVSPLFVSQSTNTRTSVRYWRAHQPHRSTVGIGSSTSRSLYVSYNTTDRSSRTSDDLDGSQHQHETGINGVKQHTERVMVSTNPRLFSLHALSTAHIDNVVTDSSMFRQLEGASTKPSRDSGNAGHLPLLRSSRVSEKNDRFLGEDSGQDPASPLLVSPFSSRSFRSLFSKDSPEQIGHDPSNTPDDVAEVLAAPFEYIRIHMDVSALESTLAHDFSTLTYWRDSVFPAAVSWIQKAILVRRVQEHDGNGLTFERLCARYWTTTDGREPWAPERRCTEFHTNSDSCGFAKMPAQHLRVGHYCPTKSDDCEILPAGDGVGTPTDLVIYVTANDTAGPCAGSSSTLGFASYCRQDQYDRPIAGNLNLCTSGGARRAPTLKSEPAASQAAFRAPSTVIQFKNEIQSSESDEQASRRSEETEQEAVREGKTSDADLQTDTRNRTQELMVQDSNVYASLSRSPYDDDLWRGDVLLVLHEIFHILGISETALAFYRDKGLKPRTLRDAKTGDPPIRSEPPYYTAGPETIMRVTREPVNLNEQARIDKFVVTPKAQEVARKLYGCPSLEGIPLENEGAEATQGDHIDKRAAFQEFLAGSIGRVPVVTALSFAILEDSGWYKPDYFWTTEMTWGSSRYTTAGCPLARGNRCIDENMNSIDDSHVCVPKPVESTGEASDEKGLTAEINGCTYDHLSYGICGITALSPPPSPSRQYFSNSALGGTVPLMDSCPVYEAFTVANNRRRITTLCTNESNLPEDFDYYGAIFGSYSRCVLGTVLKHGYVYNPNKEPQGMCYKVACRSSDGEGPGFIPSDMSHWTRVDITVRGSAGSTGTVQCSIEDGERKERKFIDGMQGYIVCPDVQRICHNHPCQNGGIPKRNVCVCQPAYFGRYCELQQSFSIRSLLPRAIFSFHYGPYSTDGVSTTVGEYLKIPITLPDVQLDKETSIVRKLSISSDDLRFQAVTPLPLGLWINATTGSLEGIPRHPSQECDTYVVAALHRLHVSTLNTSVAQSTAIIRLKVVAAFSPSSMQGVLMNSSSANQVQEEQATLHTNRTTRVLSSESAAASVWQNCRLQSPFSPLPGYPTDPPEEDPLLTLMIKEATETTETPTGNSSRTDQPSDRSSGGVHNQIDSAKNRTNVVVPQNSTGFMAIGTSTSTLPTGASPTVTLPPTMSTTSTTWPLSLATTPSQPLSAQLSTIASISNHLNSETKCVACVTPSALSTTTATPTISVNHPDYSTASSTTYTSEVHSSRPESREWSSNSRPRLQSSMMILVFSAIITSAGLGAY